MTIEKSLALRQVQKILKKKTAFGNMIAALRKCDEISQSSLAKKIKMSRAQLCDIEKGRRTATLSKAKDFARIMGYSEAQFVSQVLSDMVAEAGYVAEIKLRAA